jgi:hypothetical protein
MKPMQKISVVAGGLALLFSYQNCAPGFTAESVVQKAFSSGGFSSTAPDVVPAAVNFKSFPSDYFTVTPTTPISMDDVTLQLTTKGDFQVVNAGGTILWHSNTAAACDANCSVRLQGDGNMVLNTPAGVIWSTATYNQYGSSLLFSSTGTYLTLRDGQYKVIWTSGGDGSPGLMVASRTNKASSAYDFLMSLGIGTHVDQGIDSVDNIIAHTQVLGIRNIRDHGQPGLIESFRRIVGAGINLNLIAHTEDHAQLVKDFIDYVQLSPGRVTSLEGPNEINNWPVACGGLSFSPGWPNDGGPAGDCFMKNMFTKIRAQSALNGIPVYDLTGGVSARNADTYGLLSLAGHADYGNVHIYPSPLLPASGQMLAGLAASYLSLLPSKAVITETGYTTEAGKGVSPRAQALLTLNIFLDAFQLGYHQTFAYTMSDDGESFGFYDRSQNPKPVVAAMHNLTTILADGPPVAAPGTLAYTLTLPTKGRSLLLQKSNGHYFLVLWNEEPVWNGSGDLAPAAQAIAVKFANPVSGLRVYNPFAGTAALTDLGVTANFQGSLAAEPQILEIIP